MNPAEKIFTVAIKSKIFQYWLADALHRMHWQWSSSCVRFSLLFVWIKAKSGLQARLRVRYLKFCCVKGGMQLYFCYSSFPQEDRRCGRLSSSCLGYHIRPHVWDFNQSMWMSLSVSVDVSQQTILLKQLRHGPNTVISTPVCMRFCED